MEHLPLISNEFEAPAAGIQFLAPVAGITSFQDDRLHIHIYNIYQARKKFHIRSQPEFPGAFKIQFKFQSILYII